MKIMKKSCQRTEEDRRNLTKTVEEMIDYVREQKDAALKEYNLKFDGCTRETLRVSKEEIQVAYTKLTAQEIEDLKAAAANIRAFSKAQKETVRPLENFSPAPGIFPGAQNYPCKILLLLCAGRKLSFVFYSPYVNYSGENRRCGAGGSLFACYERN